MNTLAKILQYLAAALIILSVPFVLIMTSARVLFTPPFLEVEYRMPGFPADTYGFTLQDRLQWSKISLNYLFNDSDISYLANQKFSTGTSIYNDRELSHMADVKLVIQVAMKVWLISLGVLLTFWLWSRYSHWTSLFRRALSIGGWLTIAVLVIVLVFVLIDFPDLFTVFHELFFSGTNSSAGLNSWVFYYSDTLIRLFPMRLWQDAFIDVGVLCMIEGGLLGYFCGRKQKEK